MDKVLNSPKLREAVDGLPHEHVVDVARQVLDTVRRDVRLGAEPPSLEEVVDKVAAGVLAISRPSLRPVINATGVVIHTNLGRAPLSKEAAQAIQDAAVGYSNLELDLESGERGSRQVHVEDLLRRLTGAEAATVVNNNASAVLLTLTALVKGKEIIISRGQAVEIGGGFRIPDVMKISGAILKEVGTTNRSYISDYAEAITPETGAIMRVHSSNFKIVGFTHAPEIHELVELARDQVVLALDDLGSGCLLDTAPLGLDHEPMVQESVKAGVDVALFSGDKLLGGPQAGIIVGKKMALDIIKRHPMARAVRIDKLSLAGLSATLTHYLKGEAYEKIPVWRMLAAPLSHLDSRVSNWARRIGSPAEVRDSRSAIGGGSLPGSELPTRALAIPEQSLGPDYGIEGLAKSLRLCEHPVMARIERDCLMLDPRTVLPEEDEVLLESVENCLAQTGFGIAQRRL